MLYRPITMPSDSSGVTLPAPSTSTMLRDGLLAIVLATILALGWSIGDWQHLTRFILPDADDMMRLAQVRDWLAGQAFDDWTQYRMAPPLGAPMHWSRINDFGIAAIILAVTPLAGRHAAELTAVIAYPAILLAFNIFLSARIARRLWSPDAGSIAAILAAVAYPGITLFLPGRIDHHALQTVLIEVIILAAMHRASWRNGAVAGSAAALSLVVGLETVPQLAALVAVLAIFWTIHGVGERARMTGFAAALGGTTLVCIATMRPSYWSPAMCDAFTPASSTATLAVAIGFAALALATPLLRDWRARLAVGGILGAIVIGLTLIAYPACLAGPYGAMSPFLREAFLPHIDEANSIFVQPTIARALSITGLLLLATIFSGWMVVARSRRLELMLPPIVVIAVSALITLTQLRGIYIGAPVAAPVLAGLVLAARRQTRWRAVALLGAWMGSAGIAYAKLPDISFSVAHSGNKAPPLTTPQDLCNDGDTWAMVDRYPPGVTMAPTNMASYLIGATRLSTVGAGYHRNDRGNMAMYRYFLGQPEQSMRIAREWNVIYVAFCPGDFEEIDVTRNFPHSLATLLQSGRTPVGFQRLPLPRSRLRFYRIIE